MPTRRHADTARDQLTLVSVGDAGARSRRFPPIAEPSPSLASDVPERRAEILTTADVAALLSLRRSTVEDYARRGLLPSLKLGRHRRFIRAEVMDAVADLRSRVRGVDSARRGT